MKNKIRICRVIREMSQKELANKLDISHVKLCKLERGNYSILDAKVAWKIAKALKFPFEEVFPKETGTKEKSPAYFLSQGETRNGKKSAKVNKHNRNL